MKAGLLGSRPNDNIARCKWRLSCSAFIFHFKLLCCFLGRSRHKD